jgi:hypothetical protein
MKPSNKEGDDGTAVIASSLAAPTDSPLGIPAAAGLVPVALLVVVFIVIAFLVWLFLGKLGRRHRRQRRRLSWLLSHRFEEQIERKSQHSSLAVVEILRELLKSLGLFVI